VSNLWACRVKTMRLVWQGGEFESF
jgi:hypothetical protein